MQKYLDLSSNHLLSIAWSFALRTSGEPLETWKEVFLNILYWIEAYSKKDHQNSTILWIVVQTPLK